MKGADQCPKCGSRRSESNAQISGRVCVNCGAMWKPMPADWNPDPHTAEPCAGCPWVWCWSRDMFDKYLARIPVNKGGNLCCPVGMPMVIEGGNLVFKRVKHERACAAFVRLLKFYMPDRPDLLATNNITTEKTDG